MTSLYSTVVTNKKPIKCRIF